MLIGMLGGKAGVLQGALSVVCREWDEEGVEKCLEGTRIQ